MQILKLKDKNGKTPLHSAAWNNSLETAQILIKNNANIEAKDESGFKPLHSAACKNSTKTAQILIENNANIEPKDQYGYTHFIGLLGITVLKQLKYSSTTKQILKQNIKTALPLHRAAWGKSTETAQILIDNNANIEAKDDDGDTPLYNAAWNNSLETAQILIDNNANIEAKNNVGETPLHGTAWSDSTETAQILIDNQANIEAKDDDGKTPLHRAAGFNSLETAQILIDNKANIEAKDQYRYTPLHWAAKENSTEEAKADTHYSSTTTQTLKQKIMSAKHQLLLQKTTNTLNSFLYLNNMMPLKSRQRHVFAITI